LPVWPVICDAAAQSASASLGGQAMDLGDRGRKTYDAACHLTEVLKWLRQVQKDQHDLDFSATDSRVIACILANHIQSAMDLLEIAPTTCLEVLTPANFLEH
jgi:hypothetical protein